MAPPVPQLAPFVRQRTVLLTTCRRDGTPIGTPVSIAVEGEHAFIRTWSTAGKMKRMRRNPLVAIAPSTFRGMPTGPAILARVRVLDGEEARYAAHALARKHRILHGIMVPLFHRLHGYKTVHLEVIPAEG